MWRFSCCCITEGVGAAVEVWDSHGRDPMFGKGNERYRRGSGCITDCYPLRDKDHELQFHRHPKWHCLDRSLENPRQGVPNSCQPVECWSCIRRHPHDRALYRASLYCEARCLEGPVPFEASLAWTRAQTEPWNCAKGTGPRLLLIPHLHHSNPLILPHQFPRHRRKDSRQPGLVSIWK